MPGFLLSRQPAPRAGWRTLIRVTINLPISSRMKVLLAFRSLAPGIPSEDAVDCMDAGQCRSNCREYIHVGFLQHGRLLQEQIAAHAVETSAEMPGAKLQVGRYLQLNSARTYGKINI